MSDPPGVSIGRAAALYDLAPSALRWWESQQVLPEPSRVNGRRLYTETDLRRIGLAYLCSVSGAMSLEHASVVTSASRNHRWQRTVRDHAALLRKKIAELQRAHGYLQHLLECPDDDIVDECPYLDEELMNHTPRGLAPAGSLVAAARDLAPAAPSDPRHSTVRWRDETNSSHAAVSARCVVCAEPLAQQTRGRHRRYCSRACQQRQYRQNNRQRSA